MDTIESQSKSSNSRSTAKRTRTKTKSTKSKSDMQSLIAVAAYYKAQARGFTPGHELDDWLTAEKEIKQ
ncbi:MAG: DUF2934 domain-containing protein [Burkholderiales bacterium]|nr:DUF2934 domain-containing protein [Burkholderiales bacterium]MDR4518888.1 DUF2934 domain-containing protein [Nitrosomonas sp.]